MGKRLLLSLALLASLGAGFATVLWVTGPGHRIDREGFAMITEGMTRAETERWLRVPPGDYRSDKTNEMPRKIFAAGFLEWGAVIFGESLAWQSDEGTIWVYLGADGRVNGAQFFPNPFRQRDSVAEKLRRWLGLPWW